MQEVETLWRGRGRLLWSDDPDCMVSVATSITVGNVDLGMQYPSLQAALGQLYPGALEWPCLNSF